MAGLSWRGDPAQTRREAFDRLQEACADEETAQGEVRAAEKALAKAEEKVRDARVRREGALRDLRRALPGGAPEEPESVPVPVLEDVPALRAGEG